MVGHAKQAVGIRRQIDAHDIRLLVQRHVDEAWILMAETVVLLLPDMAGQQIVQ